MANSARARLLFRAEFKFAHPAGQSLVDNAGLDPDALLVGFTLAESRLPPVALLVLCDSRDFRDRRAHALGRSAGVVGRGCGAVRSVGGEDGGRDLATDVVGEHAAVQETVDADRRVAEAEQVREADGGRRADRFGCESGEGCGWVGVWGDVCRRVARLGLLGGFLLFFCLFLLLGFFGDRRVLLRLRLVECEFVCRSCRSVRNVAYPWTSQQRLHTKESTR